MMLTEANACDKIQFSLVLPSLLVHKCMSNRQYVRHFRSIQLKEYMSLRMKGTKMSGGKRLEALRSTTLMDHLEEVRESIVRSDALQQSVSLYSSNKATYKYIIVYQSILLPMCPPVLCR